MSEISFWERPLHPNAKEIGKAIFGSPKKMALGIWVVEHEIGEAFSVNDAVEFYTGRRNSSDAQIGGYLKEWSNPDMSMLNRLEEPHMRVQNYSRAESQFWGIFEAAKLAIDGSTSPPQSSRPTS